MSLSLNSPFEVERPWGKFIQFTKNESSTVKILTVNPHEAFSLQYHHHREEFWYVLSGEGHVKIGEETFVIHPGDHYTIPPETAHRISAGETAVEILEIASGPFDEDDIVRLEDKYGRIAS
jgi:mannose-6-phosphate isomerase-like protein (cupin superfamily)